MPELETKAEEVVQRYNEAVDKYEPRTRYGVIPFLKNLLRGQLQRRPSEIASEAESELEIRTQSAHRYAEQNLPKLKEQAAAEARKDDKEINL